MSLLREGVGQQPIERLQEAKWDVAVIGAGPAGAVAAGYLASKGHRTLILDRERFPRNKVCGDGLNHDAVRFLKRIGFYKVVESAGHRVEMARTYSTGGFTLDIPGPYITLRRKHFDSLLAKRAVQSGANFCRGKVVGFSRSEEKRHGLRVEELNKPIRARFIILATGAKIGLTKALRLWQQSAPSAVAVRCYVRSKEKVDCLVGSYARPVLPGYGWIFPMGDGLYNLGVIAFYSTGRKRPNLKKRFNGFVEEFPLARQLIRSAQTVSDLAASPLRCGLPNTVVPGEGNLLATGEAIGTTFNFTGEGIGKAMETGELAAKVIHQALCRGKDDIVTPYSRELDANFRPKYSGYATAQRWLAKPWLNDFMARRGLKSAFLRQGVIDIITGEMDPRKVFSVGGVIKSLWH
jgi:geranylgeranyl reductase family protein